MKFTVNTSDFCKAMNNTYKAAAKKSSLPILEQIKVDVINGQCTLTATNLIQQIQSKIPVFESTENCSFVFNDTKTILKGLKNFNDYKIEFDVSQNTINAVCGKRKFEVTILGAENFPNDVEFKPDYEYSYDAKKLIDRYNIVKYAISKSDTKPILTGVCFNNVDMAALDGYRLAINKDDTLNVDKKITVPDNALKLATSVLSDKISIKYSNSYISFEDNQYVVSSRLLEGDFFDYEKIISIHQYNTEINVNEFRDELSYLKSFAGKRFYVAMLNGNLEFVDVGGTYRTSIKSENICDDIIVFDGYYMLDALSQFDNNVNIEITNHVSPIMLTDGGNNIALVLPIIPQDISIYFK